MAKNCSVCDKPLTLRDLFVHEGKPICKEENHEMIKTQPFVYLAMSVLLIAGVAQSQSYEKALMLEEHGLRVEAKRELIEVIFAEQQPNTKKAQALYLLGSISIDESRIEAGLSRWRELQSRYPNSEVANQVANRADELAVLVGESAKSVVNNAVASSYLRHGDFWSRGKVSVLTIDNSWIPKVEPAIKWYDLVIAEFPSTPAARIAFESKMKTLYGWEEPGRYGSKHGSFKDPAHYMPLLVQCFEEYLSAFPSANYQQAFRYQIAQGFWRNKDWENTRLWLNKIIQGEPSGKSFYVDLAQLRLKKVKY